MKVQEYQLVRKSIQVEDKRCKGKGAQLQRSSILSPLRRSEVNFRQLGWALLFTAATLFSCNRQSEYREMVNEGLSSGIRQDSIFLGIHFGMTSEEFYKYCWEMNKRRLFLNGSGNRSVQYDISSELRHPGKMNFYPTFYEDKIYEMPVEFAYDAFTWQDTYGVDSLLTDVRGIFENWYGDFKEFTHPEKGSVWVNIQGNRQIRLFKNNLNNSVNAVFTDLAIDRAAVKKEAGL